MRRGMGGIIPVLFIIIFIYALSRNNFGIERVLVGNPENTKTKITKNISDYTEVMNNKWTMSLQYLKDELKILIKY